MFDFLDSDWFNIGLEIIFLVLVTYDIKTYLQTKKREYLTNIILTIGFAIWTLYPYYKSYFCWNEIQKSEILKNCDNNDTKLCRCIDDTIFKTYSYDEYKKLTKKEYEEFLKESKEDCLDDSWF